MSKNWTVPLGIIAFYVSSKIVLYLDCTLHYVVFPSNGGISIYFVYLELYFIYILCICKWQFFDEQTSHSI